MKIILMIFQKKFLLQAKGYFELIHCFFVFYARRFWMKVILHLGSVVPIIFLLFFYYQLEAIIYSLSYILSTPTEVVLKRKFTLLSEKTAMVKILQQRIKKCAIGKIYCFIITFITTIQLPILLWVLS